MKDIVIHIREDICARNERDPEATKLLEVAKQYGSVETLDSALASERAEHQAVIRNLSTQYDSQIDALKAEMEHIKEFKVTEEELKILRVVRAKSAIEASNYEEAIRSRDEQLKEIRLENEDRNAKIIALLK